MFRSGITLTLITVEAAIWSYDKKICRPPGKGVLPVPPRIVNEEATFIQSNGSHQMLTKNIASHVQHIFFYVSLLSLFCFLFFSLQKKSRMLYF